MRAMKDSGVDWLGEIPRHWETKPFYSLGKQISTLNKGEDERNLLSLSYGKIVRKDIESNTGLLPESFEGYQIVEEGDLVFRFTDLQNDQKSLRSALVQERGIITNAYLGFRPSAMDSRFLNYLMRFYDLQKVFYGMGSGLRQSLTFAEVRRLAVVHPPIQAQKQIADFLDRETAKIDALIAKQEQLITTLDERRGAVISRAVTRGLVENRPLRESGVEWLGEIPADWDVRPCWSSFRRVKQTGFSEEELLSVYRDHGVVPKSSRDDNHNVESEDLTSYQLVRVGDMVMNKMKAWQGSIALSDHRGIVSPAYFVYRPTQEFGRKYFHYLLRSVPYVAQYNRISKGVRVGQWDLDPTYFRTTSLIVPPVEEQRRIADFLDSETARFDQLRAEVTRMIGILAERRQALISAAVTGKLEVTDGNS